MGHTSVSAGPFIGHTSVSAGPFMGRTSEPRIAWLRQVLGFSYGEYTLACFKYLLWVCVRGALPLSIVLCDGDCSKTGYVKARFQKCMCVCVKQADLIQNPYNQREALVEQCFQLLLLCNECRISRFTFVH